MYDIYKGNSEGFQVISEGYVDYAKAIISARSNPDIRDGLKPVGRRCVYATMGYKGKGLIKSGTLVGDIMKLHPHGDSSIYEALMKMCKQNGSMLLPIFIGNGGVGSINTSDKPAAMRYTKAKYSDIADLYLRDLEVAKMVQSEEGDGMEPTVFPVRFPAALTNGTSGLAVAVNTEIPSFNVNDVLDITEEYIRNGKIDTVIVPDLPTGGVIVKDDAELLKIMHTGRGKLKTRAKVEIVGNEIRVLELPYKKTIQSVISDIDKLGCKMIKSAGDTDGRDSDCLIRIKCSSKKVTEEVLLILYQQRILQSTLASSMLFVKDGDPVFTGVYGVIEEWVNYRRGVVKALFTKKLSEVEESLKPLAYFINLVESQEDRDKFLEILIKGNGDNDAIAYLQSIFEGIPRDVASWICDLSVKSFRDGGRYKKRYISLQESKVRYAGYLEDIDGYILDDLRDVRNAVKGYSERRSEITSSDYRFSKMTMEEDVDDSPCIFTVYKDGFLTKSRTRDVDKSREILCVLDGYANSTLIGFDCYGRLLRVYCEDIPYTGVGEKGVYLPNYFDVGEYDDYRIVYMGILDGKKRMLVYRDGFVGYLDTSEWVGKKAYKIVSSGVDLHVYDDLIEVYEEDEIPEYLLVADYRNEKLRFGVAKVSDIREAGRRSRAKVFSGEGVNIGYLCGMTFNQLINFMEDPFYYTGRMRPLGDRDVYGDPELVKEGRYDEESENAVGD